MNYLFVEFAYEAISICRLLPQITFYKITGRDYEASKEIKKNSIKIYFFESIS
jgi:hypothetical protein